MYSLSQIAAALQAGFSGPATLSITQLAIDSRKISFPAQTLFFAIQTAQRDGHMFVEDAYAQGVRAFVISAAIEESRYPDAGFISVPHTLLALQQLAAIHRSQFSYPVIGITGSNGKTVVKEWLHQLLQAAYNIVRSPKSFNSKIGVPLSVWQMNAANTLGIFEAGISRSGEMKVLEKIIQPTIGLLTNIGDAHNEGFDSKQQKLEEKLKLFASVQTLVYCANEAWIQDTIEQAGIPAFSWGSHAACRLQIIDIQKQKSASVVMARYKAEDLSIQLPFTDDASIENAIHCWCIMLLLNMEQDNIAERMRQLHPVEMRLEWKQAINHCHLLNDSYSNDLSSFIIALDYLQQQQHGFQQTVILSDFAESGMGDAELYGTVAQLLQRRGVHRLIAIGPHISAQKQLFLQKNIEAVFFGSTEELLQQWAAFTFNNENILLKGARRFGFERIGHLLEQQVHQTQLEINLSAITHNLQQYRRLLKPGVKMMVMVKAFGYGSGDAEVAKLLQFSKVDYLAVAYTDEGVALRRAGIHLPVMVMNPEPTSFEAIEAYNLEPELYSFEILKAFEAYCLAQGLTQYPVHIKVDTGMHRLGFEPRDMSKLAEALKEQNILVVKSMFTHLAASEDAAHDGFTQQQASLFANACSSMEIALGYSFIKHAANSEGIRRHADKHFDMVRLGIGLYGEGPSDMNLQTVTVLKTTVAQVRKLEPGETVGYGRKGLVYRPSLIATVCIGYADGYRRQLGNGVGHMWLHGRKVPVVGQVCMDMLMLDVTGVEGVQPGDEVEVFGTHIPVKQLAVDCGTISYEILTGISQRVKRVYVTES